MNRLPEPFESVVPALDPARDVPPPARLRAHVLEAVAAGAETADADVAPAPRRPRRRTVLAVAAACLAMVAAAGTVAGLRSETAPSAPATTGWPGLPDRTPAGGARLTKLTSCPAGYLLATSSLPARTGRHGFATPQEAAVGYESPYAALLDARGLVAKQEQHVGTDWRLQYVDGQGRTLQEVLVGRLSNGSWLVVEQRDCVHRDGVPERTDLRVGRVARRCPGRMHSGIIDYVDGAGDPSPGVAVAAFERNGLKTMIGTGATAKVVERSQDRWEVVYLDDAGRYLGTATFVTLQPDHWVLESTSACERP